MRMVDLIEKTKHKIELSEEEIHYIIQGMVNGDIPDYQMSAWMMAICFNGLTNNETAILTKEMMFSGEVIDLSEIEGIKADKHSTGGVGDKTSLVLGPMLAACGLKIAKMSGRGLGHTGGTLDKLESIPGYNINRNQKDFISQVNKCNLSIIGQSDQLVPADKMMYALRDVTATIDCIPLIASSIMSKKLAAGSDMILLDVKYGDGAFMKTKEDARVLASVMCDIGNNLNKMTKAVLSDMNQPLGNAIGNILEVKEAIDTLLGNGPKDLLELCILSGVEMLLMANKAKNKEEARLMLEKTIEDHSAFNKLKEMVAYQGGKVEYIDHPELFDTANFIIPLYSKQSGYVHDLKAYTLGIVSMKLGGGRMKKEDPIDYSVGLVLNKKIGDYVKEGDVLLNIHAHSSVPLELINELYNAYTIHEDYILKPSIIEEIL